MRAQIHIPSGFTYGKVQPIILVPGMFAYFLPFVFQILLHESAIEAQKHDGFGIEMFGYHADSICNVTGTGAIGGENFESNFITLFQNSKIADPVWINPPTFQLGDAQKESEVVAYAINYISGISGQKNVSVLGESPLPFSLSSSPRLLALRSGSLLPMPFIAKAGDRQKLTTDRLEPRQLPDPLGNQILALNPQNRVRPHQHLRRLPRHRHLRRPRRAANRLTNKSDPTKSQLSLHQHAPQQRRRLSLRPHNLAIFRLLRRSSRATTGHRRLRIRPRCS